MFAPAAKKIPDFAAARKNMIEGQIRPNAVRDERILTAFENMPRELFVPENLAGVAYIDEDFPVGGGRFLLQPMVLARLLESAGVKSTDTVLDVGPATGYSTAVLAKLAHHVVAVEADADFQKRATATLAALEIKNAEIFVGPMQQGWEQKAPYDVILINGAVERVPDALFAQLKKDGRLLCVVRNYGVAHAAHIGKACLYQVVGETVTPRDLFDANVALLPGFVADSKFNF